MCYYLPEEHHRKGFDKYNNVKVIEQLERQNRDIESTVPFVLRRLQKNVGLDLTYRMYSYICYIYVHFLYIHTVQDPHTESLEQMPGEKGIQVALLEFTSSVNSIIELRSNIADE